MQSLLFEMMPRDGHEDHYFSHAAKLRPLVMQQDGLVFIERFMSLTRTNFILSHSIWRDEASIARWRTHKDHHESQVAGRFKHFADYRIRISHILQYLDKPNEIQQWSKIGLYNEPEATTDRFLLIVATAKQSVQAMGEVFESVTEEQSFLIIREVDSEEEGQLAIAKMSSVEHVNRAHLSRVSRDYGMYDRAEAPQYFKQV